jgi:D-alanyl-D-alanine carboxypeptidase
MNQNQIIEIQKEVGAAPDGFWGEESTEKCKMFLRQLMGKDKTVPAQDQTSLTAAYGKPGDESKLVNINVAGLGVKYDGKPVRTIRVNDKCADSLLLIIKELSTFPEGKEVLAEFGGCYNNRPMRGGSLPSLHARGAAVDFMAGTNGLKTHWPTKATMPFSVIKVFAKHGWLSAGAFWSRDAMHFQKTR